MRRLVGLVFVLIGLVPMLAVFWLWSRLYTVGLTVDTKALAVLSLFALADLSLLFGGAYLLRRPT
jgi:hypothetical protein